MKMAIWQQKYGQEVKLKQYGELEYQYECAIHDNCIFAFKFTEIPDEEYQSACGGIGPKFKFRLNRGYHQFARVKLNYCRDYQYI